MKKLLAILTTAALCIFIAGCGDSNKATSPQQTTEGGSGINPKWEKYVKQGEDYLVNKRDMKKAIACYEKLIALNPDQKIMALAYFNMGTAYSFTDLSYNFQTEKFVSGGLKKQLECYRKAAQLGSTGAQTWLKENGHSW